MPIDGTIHSQIASDISLLRSTMGDSFVEMQLPLLLQHYALLRMGLRGNVSKNLASPEQIRRGLRKVLVCAKRNDVAMLRACIQDVPGEIRGWYLPDQLSRQIGLPGLQGMDPGLLETAAPSQIGEAARAALEHPSLVYDRGKKGRRPDMASERLVARTRDSYEITTGRLATAWRKETGASAFLRVLGAVARLANWRVSDEQLLARARQHLAAEPRTTPLFIVSHRTEK